MEALQKVGFQEMDMNYKAEVIEYGDKQIRRHWIQYWQKITMALACLMFFFIGAPLGAIIRKGGLGFPVVVAVIIFIVYYIINTFGMKVSREGDMPVWLGMWLSTIVLAPLGVFFTVKSNNDSAVFNMDATSTCGDNCWASAPSATSLAKRSSSTTPTMPTCTRRWSSSSRPVENIWASCHALLSSATWPTLCATGSQRARICRPRVSTS